MANQWIRDCYECNVGEIFSELVKFVEQDVEEMEKLNKNEQPDPSVALPRVFHTSWSNDNLTMYVKLGILGGSPNTLCSISFKDDHIAIEILIELGQYEAEIRPSWDLEHAQCLLSISDREDPIRRDDLWKVVQGFLKPVFFPDR